MGLTNVARQSMFYGNSDKEARGCIKQNKTKNDKYEYIYNSTQKKKTSCISMIFKFIYLFPQSWSDQLASEAGAWIKSCNFEHQMKGRGENLAFDSNPGELQTILKGSMDSWFSEKKDFNRNANSCYMSCHYTQVSIVLLLANDEFGGRLTFHGGISYRFIS